MPQPYDFALSTERFRAFGPDLANLWHEGGLHRVVDGREVRIEPAAPAPAPAKPAPALLAGSVEPTPVGVEVDPLDAETEPVVRALLGLAFDLGGFASFAAGEPQLAAIVPRLTGFRPPLAPEPFEALVSSVCAQQVSLHAAFAIRNRLIERYGERGEHAYAFPTRDRIAAAREGDLVALGFSRRKEEYVLALARSDFDLHALAALPDDEVKERIVALRGLGEWTADWFLARHLARPRAWPAGDLAVRKAVVSLYGDVDVRAAGARFDPYQNLTAHYLVTAQRVL